MMSLDTLNCMCGGLLFLAILIGLPALGAYEAFYLGPERNARALAEFAEYDCDFMLAVYPDALARNTAYQDIYEEKCT